MACLVGQQTLFRFETANLRSRFLPSLLLPLRSTYQALRFEPDQTKVVSSGALATTSGQKTGRSPKDKRVVREDEFEKDVWWGKYSPNYQMDDR